MQVKQKCCKKCGGSDFTNNGKCKPCAYAYTAEWRIKNQDRIKQYRKDNSERDRATASEYRIANIDKIRARIELFNCRNPGRSQESKAKYYSENVDIVKARAKAFYEKTKDRQLENCRAWNANNPDKVREMQAKSKAKDRGTPIGSLKHVVGARVRGSIKRNGYSKTSKTREILGCDWEFLKGHIEKQFTKGMSWENRIEWHLDHIVPLSSAETEGDVIALNHFTNLRPMWAVENMKKGCRITHLI